MSFLENKNDEIERQIDRQEQHSRRNRLLIHSIKERINQTHRIGAKTENKRQPIIVKFVRYLERRKVFNSKKRLKGKSFHY